MESIFEWLRENRQYVLAAGGVALTLMAVKRLFFHESASSKLLRKKYPKDKVILVQIGRGPCAPSLSPYPLKVETYLRMAKIPYENEQGMHLSSKGKTPFIIYNGKEVPDSQFIIEFINKEKGVDLNQNLSTEEKAIARAFLKMTEENFYWTLVSQRWVHTEFEYLKELCGPHMSRFMLWGIRKTVQKEMWGHGIGRHAREEILGIMEKDMRALSDYLGGKNFFFGEEPSEVDCALFGMLAQVRWHFRESPPERLMNGELKNLARYCDRMKERFWPDWDDCITHNYTKKATK